MSQWQSVLMEFCRRANIEPVLDSDKLVLVCPDELTGNVKANIQGILGGSDVQFQFIVSPKPSTMKILGELVKEVEREAEPGSPGISRKEGRLIIDLKGVPESHPFWGRASSALKTDGFFKQWTFVIDGREVVVNAKVLAEQNLNAKFERKLDEDDVTNVKIALESAKSVDEFLASL